MMNPSPTAAHMGGALPSDLQRLVTPLAPRSSPEPNPPAMPFPIVRNPESGFITLDSPKAKFGLLALLVVGYVLLSNGTLRRLYDAQTQPAPQMQRVSPFDQRRSTVAPAPASVNPAIPNSAAAPASTAMPAGSPDEETALSAPATLTGKWEGSANTETGICHLKLEIMNAVDMPGIKG